jgi:hypothetical protein
MDKIPSLSLHERILFWLIHLIIAGFPLVMLILIIYSVPDYFLILIDRDIQPWGWIVALIICLGFGILIFLGINSLINIDRRPINQSIIVIIFFIIASILDFNVILLLPALLLLLKIIPY